MLGGSETWLLMLKIITSKARARGLKFPCSRLTFGDCSAEPREHYPRNQRLCGLDLLSDLRFLRKGLCILALASKPRMAAVVRASA